MSTTIRQTANDSDATAFDTFVQQDSIDMSGNTFEQPLTAFTIGGWL